ncbi:copper resistance system multicopper oxidase [Caulobacter sp.]|uniref:copper resistance system multicopper oxidase n=1 Tax=Caulobacter sp. TaxID=78 RepID=UPI003BA93763
MQALDRRQMLVAGATAGLAGLLPAWARASDRRQPATLSGEEIALTIGHAALSLDGKAGHAMAVNGTVPGPLIRLKEGQRVRLSVTNTLDEDTSIHWHGLLVPFQFDGVPGVSFPGIKPGETFVYDFKVRQSGTYWYHSHSGLQEQMGVYGPIVIDPATLEAAPYDREHVVVLSDYSFLHPHQIMRKLKAQAGYFNDQKQTVAGLLAGRDQSLKDRLEWSRMRMDPTDILDVTGSAYTYLINGHGPGDNWTGLFTPGERVRLRFVNAGGMTTFNVRVPGLSMTVVSADGQNVQPVGVEEFQIAPAETYDVIVRPVDDRAFTLVAEAADRSGLARATLAPRPGMSAPVPPLRARPLATMKDMGMDMGGMDMSGMSMDMRDPANAPPTVKLGPGVQSITPMPADRLGEPPQGLEDVGHKVLVYTDLIALDANPDTRPPGRTVEIHLTGNMERFMWAFDGEAFGPLKKPIAFQRNERVRVLLVNDSMMAHPIHLHGHFFEVVNGHDGHHPRKHTVNVAPGGKVAFDLTADEPGDWAFHCHMLLHMHAGMFNVVTVRPLDGASA